MATMKQMILSGPRKTEITEVPVPEIKDNELLVRVTLSGMCRSEWYPWATAKYGETIGHEWIGVVEKVGANVKDFEPGERVTGLGGGAYKEFIVTLPEKTVRVPDNLSDEDAIAEPLACQLSAATKLPLTLLGDTVAVVGCGYMGLGVISLFKVMGYGKIIAVDERAVALENAEKFGATELYFPEEIPKDYISDFSTIAKPDLTRSGTNRALFSLGLDTVMEFSGTQSGLSLAGRLTGAHAGSALAATTTTVRAV